MKPSPGTEVPQPTHGSPLWVVLFWDTRPDIFFITFAAHSQSQALG